MSDKKSLLERISPCLPADGQPPAAKRSAGTNHRAGDWVCLLCNNHNYSFRDCCNRCRVQTKTQNIFQSLAMIQTQNQNKNHNIPSQNLPYSSQTFLAGSGQAFQSLTRATGLGADPLPYSRACPPAPHPSKTIPPLTTKEAPSSELEIGTSPNSFSELYFKPPEPQEQSFSQNETGFSGFGGGFSFKKGKMAREPFKDITNGFNFSEDEEERLEKNYDRKDEERETHLQRNRLLDFLNPDY